MSKATIRILLKENVSQLGKAGSLVRVKAGHARNYLIPKKLAVAVTPSIMKQVERFLEIERQKQIEIEKSVKTTEMLLQTIKKITVKKKIGKDNAIFGTITDREVSQILSDLINQKIDKKLIEIPDIKTTGCYEVMIKLSSSICVNLDMHILPVTVVN